MKRNENPACPIRIVATGSMMDLVVGEGSGGMIPCLPSQTKGANDSSFPRAADCTPRMVFVDMREAEREREEKGW